MMHALAFYWLYESVGSSWCKRLPLYRGFVITLRHTTLGRTPLDEWSARRRELYLTKHNTLKRQKPMPPAVFERTIPASERPQTHPLDRAATGIGRCGKYLIKVSSTKKDGEVSGMWLWELQSREFFSVPIQLHGPPLWSSGLGFDSRRYQIFWVAVGLERGTLVSLVRSIEELLE